MFRQVTDNDLAWELRKEGMLYWKPKWGDYRPHFTDAQGFGWSYSAWMAARFDGKHHNEHYVHTEE